MPEWTTLRVGPALSAEIGHQDKEVLAVAVLADGRVVTGGTGGQVLVWDPDAPGASPVELGVATRGEYGGRRRWPTGGCSLAGAAGQC